MSTAATAFEHPVIVMEDDDAIREEIRGLLQKHGFKVRLAHSEREVLQVAKAPDCRFFVLDADMGATRSQEGLDALERLKKLHPTAFVAIYTLYTDRFETMAKRLRADAFQQKTDDKKRDISSIVGKIKQYMQKTGLAVPGESVGTSPSRVPETPEQDPNFVAYQELLGDSEWVRKYKGAFAGIVDGKLIAVHTDRTTLLKELRTKYPEKQRFVMRVGEERVTFEIPSLFSLDET
jgi:DNA-binding NtrC family response regulator